MFKKSRDRKGCLEEVEVVFEKGMAEEMRGRQGQPPQQGRPRPNVVSPFPFGSPLHQVSVPQVIQQLECRGGQKLCFANLCGL